MAKKCVISSFSFLLSCIFFILPLSLKAQHSVEVKKTCGMIEKKFKEYNWQGRQCLDYSWNAVRKSVLGTPLIWSTFGNEKDLLNKKDTTLVLCGVHGDEITPVKFCFDILNYLKENYSLYQGKVFVIAPLVNPDSFLNTLSRTNHHGVDINRNFPTVNWGKQALQLWKNSYHKDPRRYPGHKAMSEPEVTFQVNLIKRYKPNKILSVHAPLTMLDYDGPQNIKKEKNNHGEMAYQLLLQMSKSAQGYRIKNFRTYPGSLGNWAGEERKIPTYTLELPTTDASESENYWKLFKTAIHQAFMDDLGLAFSQKSSKEVAQK